MRFCIGMGIKRLESSHDSLFFFTPRFCFYFAFSRFIFMIWLFIKIFYCYWFFQYFSVIYFIFSIWCWFVLLRLFFFSLCPTFLALISSVSFLFTVHKMFFIFCFARHIGSCFIASAQLLTIRLSLAFLFLTLANVQHLQIFRVLSLFARICLRTSPLFLPNHFGTPLRLSFFDFTASCEAHAPPYWPLFTTQLQAVLCESCTTLKIWILWGILLRCTFVIFFYFSFSWRFS